MAVVGKLTHVRCKVMYRCVCARHCAVETDTQPGYRKRRLETNLGFYSAPTQLMSPSHDDSHAITPYLGNKVICDWHTSNVHSTFGVETRDVQSRWYHGTHIQIHIPQNFSCLQPIFAIWSFARRPQFFVVGRTVTNLSLLCICPACPLLQ